MTRDIINLDHYRPRPSNPPAKPDTPAAQPPQGRPASCNLDTDPGEAERKRGNCQMTDTYDVRHPRRGGTGKDAHLRTFASRDAAEAARVEALEAIGAIAEDAGLTVAAFVFSTHRDPDLRAGVDEASALYCCTPADKVTAADTLEREPAVITHRFAQMLSREALRAQAKGKTIQ